jgi:hypothetical protein
LVLNSEKNRKTQSMGSLYLTNRRNVVDWFANAFYTFGVAFITWALLTVAVWAGYYYPHDDPLRIYPITYYTAICVVSLVLPLTSTFYLLFDLRLRRNQIEDAAVRGQIQLVYCMDKDNAARELSRLVRQRFREACQPWELVAFSTIAGAIAFVGTILVFYNAFESIPDKDYYKIIDPSRVVIFAAFSGSLAGAYVYLFNRFRTFDVYPSTYLQASIGFISGSLGAVFIGTDYPSATLEFLAFAIGFLTAVNVSFLSNLLRRELAHLTGIKLPIDVSGDLDRIIQNAGAIESLHNIAIYSVAELVKADPLTIYLSLPAPIGSRGRRTSRGLIPTNQSGTLHGFILS